MIGFKVQADLSPADWLAPLLRRWGQDAWPPRVDSLVPPVFDAYARVLVESESGALLPVAGLLAPNLRVATTTPERCWYGIWDGYGDLRLEGPVFETCHRRYFLLLGSIELATTLTRAPDLWWPEDRAWFLAGDIDQRFAFLGAAEGCVAAVLGQSGLRADRAESDWPIDVAGEAEHPFTS